MGRSGSGDRRHIRWFAVSGWPKTCANIARKAAIANLNYRELFYSPYPAGTFTVHEHAAVQKIVPIVQQVSRWELSDTLEMRGQEIEVIIGVSLDSVRSQAGREAVEQWRELVAGLPTAMNLEEVLSYLWTDTEAGQLQVLDAVDARLQAEEPRLASAEKQSAYRSVRILTMHGAKGLDGDVVFIPGLEQGVLPSSHALRSPGLVQEARRLLYVSMTRARAACFLSLAKVRTGQQAFALSGGPTMKCVPSSFLTDVGITPMARGAGLTASEVAAIVADCASM